MNKEKVKLIIRNMELLLTSLKEELDNPPEEIQYSYTIDDYDEVYVED